MSNIESQLEKLEARLQSLIEGSTMRLFPEYRIQFDLVTRISRAMRTAMEIDSQAKSIPPNRFTIQVHPSQAIYFQENPALQEELRDLLQQAGGDSGLVFLSPPEIRVKAKQELPPGEVRVTAEYNLNKLIDTMDYKVDHNSNRINEKPEHAFLIVNGISTFQLDNSLVNIGRRADNHLVIDDPRVSRRHAQLRVTQGRFVIFDLDSTGGTFVNGERISKRALQPGDVISLSGLPLVYGQESLEEGDTQKYPIDDVFEATSQSETPQQSQPDKDNS